MSPVKLPQMRGLVDSCLLCCESEGKSCDPMRWYWRKRGAFQTVVTAAEGCDLNPEARISEGAC